MKKISLLFAFVALFATASFAGTHDVKPFKEKKTEPLVVRECTVTVSWPNGSGGSNTLTVTTSCNTSTQPTCTTQSACNAAYAIISVVVPG